MTSKKYNRASEAHNSLGKESGQNHAIKVCLSVAPHALFAIPKHHRHCVRPLVPAGPVKDFTKGHAGPWTFIKIILLFLRDNAPTLPGN